MFCTFKCRGTLLVVVKLAITIASDDCQQLDHVLVAVGLDICIHSLDLTVKLQQALSEKEGICMVLVLIEQGDSLG